MIKFLKLSLNNILILFKEQIYILLFIGFFGFPINIKLNLSFYMLKRGVIVCWTEKLRKYKIKASTLGIVIPLF